MLMGRAGGLLVDGTAEEHLRIGALEDAGDASAPLELLVDDRPDGLMSSLGILDLLAVAAKKYLLRKQFT